MNGVLLRAQELRADDVRAAGGAAAQVSGGAVAVRARRRAQANRSGHDELLRALAQRAQRCAARTH